MDAIGLRVHEEKINTLIKTDVQENINLAYQLLLGYGMDEINVITYVFSKQIEYCTYLEETIYYFNEGDANGWELLEYKLDTTLSNLSIYIQFYGEIDNNYISLWQCDTEIQRMSILPDSKKEIIKKIEELISFNEFKL